MRPALRGYFAKGLAMRHYRRDLQTYRLEDRVSSPYGLAPVDIEANALTIALLAR